MWSLLRFVCNGCEDSGVAGRCGKSQKDEGSGIVGNINIKMALRISNVTEMEQKCFNDCQIRISESFKINKMGKEI